MTVVRTSIQYLAPTTSSDVVSGFGFVPIGTIVGWVPGFFSGINNVGYNRSLGSTDDVTGANTYLTTMGWRVCDGGEPNDTVSPIWNAAGKKVPQLNDRRFLQGSSFISLAAGNAADPIDVLNTAGTIQGSLNTMSDHVHGAGTAAISNVNISHSHVVNTIAGTLVAANESSHTHGATGLGTGGAGSHSHAWPPRQAGGYEGNWSTDNSGSIAVSGGYGDGTQNTYSDGNASINDWGSSTSSPNLYASRVTNSDSGALSHSHSIRTNSFAGDRPVGMGGGGLDDSWYMISDAPITNQGALYAASDNASLAHTHTYYLPSHRHWIKTRATTDNPADHSHSVTGATAAGAAHTHVISGSVDASTGTGQTQHTHSLTGSVGTGNVPTATENRPQYLRCFMIIRIK